MKILCAFCLTLLGFTSLYAQAPSSASDTDKIFLVVQQKPEFKGNLYQWLAGNVSYPQQAKDSNIQGTVYVLFVIEKDGSISNEKLLRGTHSSLDKEALRAIAAMPEWTPGMQNGHTVRVQYTLPVNFMLENNIPSHNNKNQDSVYTNVQQPPKFPGDIQQWIIDSIRFSDMASASPNQDTICLSFIVEKDGSVSNIHVHHLLQYSADSIAVSIGTKMPKWVSGMQDGKPVKVRCGFAVIYSVRGSRKLSRISLPFILDNNGKPEMPQELSTWVSGHINYPEEAIRKKIEGKVTVSFNVLKNGSVSHVAVVKGIKDGEMLNKEAERIVSAMPKWTTPYRVDALSATIVFSLKADSTVKAQNLKYESQLAGLIKSGRVYSLVMELPNFPGDYGKWLSNHLEYPENAQNADIQGTVLVSFFIEKDGEVTQAKIIKGVNKAMDDRAIQVISKMPNWTPETIDGTPKQTTNILPVIFMFRNDLIYPSSVIVDTTGVYKINASVYSPPQFPGDMNDWLVQNTTSNGQSQGEAYVSFVIETDGSISTIRFLRSLPFEGGLGDAAVRIVHSMPKWKPGRDVNGNPVPVNYCLGFIFGK